MAGRLGDILVSQGHLDESQLNEILSIGGGGRLGERLLTSGFVNTAQLGSALSEQFDVEYRTLTPQTIKPQIIQLIPESFSRKNLVVPLEVAEERLTLAMECPDDIETISEVELMTGYSIEPVVSMASDVTAAIDYGFDDRLVARQTVVDLQLAELRETSDDLAEDVASVEEDESAPVVRLVQAILTGAINAGTSDIHLESLRAMREFNGHISAIAYPILYKTGQLLETRLINELSEQVEV